MLQPRPQNNTENWLSSKKPLPKTEALFDLVHLVSTSNNLAGKGCARLSEHDMSYRWGWSRTKLRNFLECLKTRDIIQMEKTRIGTSIIINHFDEIWSTIYQLQQLLNTQTQTPDSYLEPNIRPIKEHQEKPQEEHQEKPQEEHHKNLNNNIIHNSRNQSENKLKYSKQTELKFDL